MLGSKFAPAACAPAGLPSRNGPAAAMVLHDGGHVLALADFVDEDLLFVRSPAGTVLGEGNGAAVGRYLIGGVGGHRHPRNVREPE